MIRALIIASSFLWAACGNAPVHLFDGGDCSQRAEDGGFTPSNPHELPCSAPGDTCRVTVYDDPCPTACGCGSDGGWSCTRTCRPLEPCTVGGFCGAANQTESTCDRYDGGCSLVCFCAFSAVSHCSVQCP